MKLLTIGPDKDLLRRDSVASERHKVYASRLEELHAVIFARKQYGSARVEVADNAWSYPTGSRGVFGLFRDAYRIGRSILRAPGEWVVSAQDPFESGLVGYALARATGTPLLLQEHGDFFSLPHWRRESFLNRVRYVVGLWLLRRATHVRVVSERIRETLVARGVARERISVAPVHTDVQAFESATPSREISALRPEGGVLILTMARLVPQKNLTLLIDAFRIALAQGVHARLVILGKGPEKNMLLARAGELVPERITFLDWTDDPAGALKAADIYALSSNYEGWGRVCIESLAAGTPLLMTDVGCAHEVVCDGENGIVVPVGDRDAFASALVRLAQDPSLRTRVVRAGRETVRHLETSTDQAQLYEKTLKCCIVHPHEHANGVRNKE